MNKKLNKQNGITLIALVITIIVMLILVAVTISMAVNGGLFNYAGKATGETQNAINAEQELADGRIKVGDYWYDSVNEYLAGKISDDQGEETGNTGISGNNGETFSAPYTKTEKNNYEDKEGNKATIPAGFSVGTSEGINKISTGLVIRDKEGNEFVWIPVEGDLAITYSSNSGYSEPTELKDNYTESSAPCDSQTTLNTLYGENHYNYENDFNYTKEYGKMVTQVNEYDGFYIGRYETTTDENGKIGSKYDTEVLTATGAKGETALVGWHTLYMLQKNANVTGNGTDVQTAMIYGQLWDKTMEFIRKQKTAGKTNYDVDSSAYCLYQKFGKSGQVNPKTEDNDGDIALNIYDLGGNIYECTQEGNSSSSRVARGGNYSMVSPASTNWEVNILGFGWSALTYCGSRLALYIK